MTCAPAVAIVTPTFNSERFLDATMASVIGQEPDEHGFVLHYHVQDGGSSDGTLEIVRRWQGDIAAAPANPLKQIFLTVASEPDRGMYDAINKGFAATPYIDCQLMTWINSDDLLAPNAVSTALAVVRDVPEVDWIGTQVALIDELGTVTGRWKPALYTRSELTGGLYTGRKGRAFVQQEGTFWRPKLWRAVDGLDASFRLAGDWDLWRRFAEFASLTLLDVTLGFHRRHDQQLSNELSKYHAEVDVKISTDQIKTESGLPERIHGARLDSNGWVPNTSPKVSNLDTRAYRKHSNKLIRELSRINHQRLNWQQRHFGRS